MYIKDEKWVAHANSLMTGPQSRLLDPILVPISLWLLFGSDIFCNDSLGRAKSICSTWLWSPLCDSLFWLGLTSMVPMDAIDLVDLDIDWGTDEPDALIEETGNQVEYPKSYRWR
jgi:hypothetical protein